MKVTIWLRRKDEEVGKILAENDECDEACLRDLYARIRTSLKTPHEETFTFDDVGTGMSFDTADIVEARLYEDDVVVEEIRRA